VTFQNELSLYYQFEDELPSQEAYATCSTDTRVLLVDHSKFGKKARRRANVSIETLLTNANSCYVITTYDPSDQNAVDTLTREEESLREQLKCLAHQNRIPIGKDFIFRLVRNDNEVERELRLSQFRETSAKRHKSAKKSEYINGSTKPPEMTTTGVSDK
jgi:hypothetical protein